MVDANSWGQMWKQWMCEWDCASVMKTEKKGTSSRSQRTELNFLFYEKWEPEKQCSAYLLITYYSNFSTILNFLTYNNKIKC